MRADMWAALVGLLIAAIGLCDNVSEDLRLLNTRGEGGTDADVGVVAEGGPARGTVRAEWVRSAASFGRRLREGPGTPRVAEPVYEGSNGVCGAVDMGVGVVDRLRVPAPVGTSVERNNPVAKRREYPGGDAVVIMAVQLRLVSGLIEIKPAITVE